MSLTSPSTCIPLIINFLLKSIIPIYIFPSLSKQLDDSVLFSTPVNSFKTLKEGWFLLTRLKVDPYDAMINHPPLLIQLSTLFDLNNDTLITVFYSIVDTLILYNVIQLEAKLRSQNSSLSLKNNSPSGIVWFYLLNPLIFLGTVSRNTILFTNLFIVSSLKNLVLKNWKSSVLQLAIAAYLSILPIFLIIPYANYIKQTSPTTSIPKLMIISIIGLSLLCLHHFSFQVSKVVQNCYISILTFEKIQPNLGLWWYFFIEIFDFFHDFYIGVFNMYSFVFIIPFTYRFSKTPNTGLFIILISILWITFTKSYPTLSDFNLSSILLLTLQHNYLNRLRVPIFLTLIIMSVVLVLLVLFYYLWVNLNSGNSNFFYGVGLVYNILIAWTICDLIWVQLQQEWYNDNKVPEELQFSKTKLTQL